jgi:hypothetical protein
VVQIKFFSQKLFLFQFALSTERRTLNGKFHAIEVSGGIKLTLYKGDSQTAWVKATQEDYRKKIKTMVVNDTLKIFFYYKDDPTWKGLVGSKEIFEVLLSVNQLNYIKISEGAMLNIPVQIPTSQLFLTLITGGEMMAKIKCDQLTVKMQDGSHAQLSGTAINTNFTVIGGSRFLGRNLISANCTATLSGASELYLNVTRQLNANASNYSSIFYTGQPILIKKEITNGRVKHY